MINHLHNLRDTYHDLLEKEQRGLIIQFSDGRFWHRFNGKVTRPEQATTYKTLSEASMCLAGLNPNHMRNKYHLNELWHLI